MGIRGLSTFFNQNPEFFKPFKLHDSVVVFDGNNLIHALYFNYRVNFMYGGDYNKYADSIRRYFLRYMECNIKPILVFDGGIDKSGKKLQTLLKRQRQKLAEIEFIVKHGCSSGKVLPLLAHEVFISVLGELDIAFAQCDYEADDQITALANYYKCPVISADSDFYIYDIHNGFINIASIDLAEICIETDAEGKEYKYLRCNIYHVDEFISHFPGIDKTVLPLFGTLIGNDYVEGKVFDNFFSNIQLPKYRGRRLILNSNQKKMIGLLCWLKHKTLNEAVDQVIEYLKKDRREYVKSIIGGAVDSYNLQHCNLTSIIDQKLYNCKIEKLLSNRLVTPCGNYLPMDFMVKFHSAQYCSFFINAIVSHKVFLRPLIEDISYPSSYRCSRYIRQVMYGILIRHKVDDKICDSKNCLAYVEESDRQRTFFQKELVEPVFSVAGFGNLPELDVLSSFEREHCRLLLVSVLGVTSDLFSSLPEDWQLFIGCCKYWLWNCTPHSTEAFVYALVINLIYFSLIKLKYPIGDHFKSSHKNIAHKNCSCTSCVLPKITESELDSARKNLEKYRHKSSFNHGNPLILHIIHSYSQLQVCILNTVTLNKLLGNGVKNPDLDKCFSGTMLYNLTKDILSRPNPLLFVAELLGRGSNLYLLFTELNTLICHGVPTEYILKKPISHKKSKKKSKRLNASDHGNEDVCKILESLSKMELL